MLSDNDRQRIEQEAKKHMRKYYGTEINFLRDSPDPDYELKLFNSGAEYATLYERSQSSIEIAKLKEEIAKLKSNDDQFSGGE